MQRGFTLIEIIVAISVVIIGVVGIYALVPYLVERVSVNQDRFTAAQLAREGLEIIRNIRESNWLEKFEDVTNPWDESLDNCLLGCEMDYTILDVQDPVQDVTAGFNSWAGLGSYLRIDPADGFYKYTVPGGQDTRFRRKITIDPSIDPVNGDQLDVKVEVFYGSSASKASKLL